MELLVHNLSEVFAVSIIHSLWQCLLIYLVLRILLADILRISAAMKHNITLLCMLAGTAWFIYTLFDQSANFSWHISTNTPAAYIPQDLPLIGTIKEMAKSNDRYEMAIEQYLPYISIIYALGLLFQSLKLVFGYIQLKELKRSGTTDSFWQQKVAQLSGMLGLQKITSISITDRIDVPCITGYLKPVILLPISLTTYLSVIEVEAILLHELAHVKRNDYLLNLLQQAISVILFFNPFILLMNRVINRERENSCDDMVVTITGTPLVYAQALLKTEQNKAQQWQLALAATGRNKFQLLNRIERIMKTQKPMANVRHIVMAFTILAITLVSVAWFNPAIGHGKISVKKIKPVIGDLFADTVKKKAKPAKTAKKAKLAKSYGYNNNQGDTYYFNGPHYTGPRDPKLEAMGRRMEEMGKKLEAYYNSGHFKQLEESMNQYGKAMDQYYSSADYKKLQESMEQYGKQMDAYYNSPEYKKLAEEMEQKGKELESYYDNPEFKKLQLQQEKLGQDLQSAYGDTHEMAAVGEKMGKLGKKMETYYNSNEFKKLDKDLRKKYNIPEDMNYGDDRDENYRRYHEELRQHTPADVLEASKELKNLGDQMRSHYNSPAIRAKSAQLRAMGDSMRNAYNNPHIKQVQEDMRRLSEQMRNYNNNGDVQKLKQQMRDAGQQMRNYNQNANMRDIQQKMKIAGADMRAYTQNPEIKKLQENMRELGDQMRAYTNTPEFKKKMDDWRKAHPEESWNWKDDSRSDSVDKPEKPEKQEKAEKPEATEKAEKP